MKPNTSVCTLMCAACTALQVSLSGILEMKATSYTHVEQMKPDAHGMLVAENTLGVYHGHFITYQLVLVMDGTNNGFVKNTMVPMRNLGTLPQVG